MVVSEVKLFNHHAFQNFIFFYLLQIFYFICAGALNNLLLRKDMCHWSKGMQIRFNLSHLEQWARDMRLHEAGVTDTLAPIIQAAQILQARKTDADVNSICEMCDKLTVSQVGIDQALE